ncbi:hypothetical protein RHGRI_032561 [Rhododendron griersonianum]|uniref:KOW domain-containing protein n=1 Tax=Rhododendron griersonianum TaxID=479676 RepID=A0AAV6IFH9_9ERIC|nr:hypothetical protein RHGRI_032561 [Rhododendron griersonianum]
MLANKKPQTSYAQLPQETKDKRNHRCRELDGNLTEVSRAERNKRRRFLYANLPNTYANLPQSIKDKHSERRRQLRLAKEKNHKESTQSVCTPISYESECQEIECTMVSAQTAHPTDSEVIIEALPARTIPTDQNSTPTPVAGVIREELVHIMVPAQSAHPRNSEVVIEAEPAETIPADQDCTQPYVTGVIREVPWSSIHCRTTGTHKIGSSSRVTVATAKRPSIVAKVKLKWSPMLMEFKVNRGRKYRYVDRFPAINKRCMSNAKAMHKLPERNISVTPHKKDFKKVNQLPTTVDKVQNQQFEYIIELDLTKEHKVNEIDVQQEFHWIKASCKVVDVTQKFWYLSCSKCSNATDAMTDDLFWCYHCKKRVSPVVKSVLTHRNSLLNTLKNNLETRKIYCIIPLEMFNSLKFHVELSDKTGSIVATAFPPDAEGMFGITAEYMRETYKRPHHIIPPSDPAPSLPNLYPTEPLHLPVLPTNNTLTPPTTTQPVPITSAPTNLPTPTNQPSSSSPDHPTPHPPPYPAVTTPTPSPQPPPNNNSPRLPNPSDQTSPLTTRPTRTHRPPGYLQDYLCPTLPTATTASTPASSQSSVEKVDEDNVHIRSNAEGLPKTLAVNEKELCKYFEPGNHVKVVCGALEGATGMVIKVEGHVVIIVSDTTKEDIRVIADNVAECSEGDTLASRFSHLRTPTHVPQSLGKLPRGAPMDFDRHHISDNTVVSTPYRSGMGSETPMHPSRTPLHPYMTPMRDPGATPIHDGMRTPMRDRAWNPYTPMSPPRDNWENAYPGSWGTSPQYQPGSPPSSRYEAPTPGSGWANTPSDNYGEAGTPRANAPSPYLPSTPGGHPMTPSSASYLPDTPGWQPMTPHTWKRWVGYVSWSRFASMTFDVHFFTGGDDEGLWALPDVLVNVRRSGEDTVIGVVRDVLSDGSCRINLGSSGDGDTVIALSSQIDLVVPRKSDKVKIMSGALRGSTGKLIGVDGSDGIVKQDATFEVRILEMNILAKVAQS